LVVGRTVACRVAEFARIRARFKVKRGAAMQTDDPFENRNDYLKRLAPEYYQGQSYVHWSMTIEDRKTGWLIPIFYYKFREILTHTLFRYGLCCPIYC
jgi:hypothetical protein